jgi:hypothetical protein
MQRVCGRLSLKESDLSTFTKDEIEQLVRAHGEDHLIVKLCASHEALRQLVRDMYSYVNMKQKLTKPFDLGMWLIEAEESLK